MNKLFISKIYIFSLRIIEAFLLSLSIALLLISIYPIKILIVSIISSIFFIIYVLNSLKFLKDKEIAWLYEFKYKNLKEALITFVELRIKSIYEKIPFKELNPFSIYRPKFEFLLILFISLTTFIFSFHFRKPLYIANYGNYERKIIIEGFDEYFIGEDIILEFKNKSYLDEITTLKPINKAFKIRALSEIQDTIKNLSEGNYYFEFSNKRIFEFKVFQRPIIDSIIISINTPHLNLNQKFKNTYEISAIEGSNVNIKVYTNADKIEPFSNISFIPKSDTQIEFYLYKSKKFYKYPNALKITLLKDNPPFVKIIYPESFVYLPENYKIPIFSIALDDYGLKDIQILVNNKLVHNVKTKNVLKDSIFYNLDLSGEKLLPGDEIKVEVRAIDMKNQISSDFITIKFPTLAEQMNLSNQTIGENQTKIQDIREKLNDITDNIKRSETKGDIEAISNQLKEIQNQMKELGENINQISKNLQLDLGLQEQLRRIAELYQSILNDELKQILKKIEQALSKVDKEEIRKALENIKIDIEKLKNSLKATEKTLRRFYEEQKLREIANKLNELADKQENVKNKDEQNKITDELKNIERDLNDISKTIESPFSDSLKNITNELSDIKNQSQFIEQNWPNSQGYCSSNAKSMRNVSERINKLQNDLVQKRKEEIVKKIENLRRSLIFISQHQETKDELEQKSIMDAIKLSIRDFEELAQMNFLIAMDIKAHLYIALENAQEVYLRYKYNDFKRAKNYKNSEKKEILTAILKLYNIQNQVMSASSSTGYSEMLKNLANTLNNQMQLGQKMQSLSNQNLSEELLKQLAIQQEMIRKMIQGIREGMEKTGQGKEYSEKLKEIEKQIQDLENEIKDKKKIDRRIIEKHREIMHRLLEAYTGLKTEEKTQNFEAEKPKNIIYEEPKISENMIYRQKIIEILRKIQRIDVDENQRNKLIEFYQNLLKEF
ncbi:MAG: hypothetical protein ABIL89_02655 [candidate division WOR-3 bacterium]